MADEVAAEEQEEQDQEEEEGQGKGEGGKGDDDDDDYHDDEREEEEEDEEERERGQEGGGEPRWTKATRPPARPASARRPPYWAGWDLGLLCARLAKRAPPPTSPHAPCGVGGAPHFSSPATGAASPMAARINAWKLICCVCPCRCKCWNAMRPQESGHTRDLARWAVARWTTTCATRHRAAHRLARKWRGQAEPEQRCRHGTRVA